MLYAVYALAFVLLFDVAFVAIMHRYGKLKERHQAQRNHADWLRTFAEGFGGHIHKGPIA